MLLIYGVSSFVGFIVMMLLDYVWLAQIAKSFYLEKLSGHITIENNSLVPYVPAVVIFYIIAIISIWVLALPHATSLLSALVWGAILGFLMYAFYDFTNLATLQDYPWSLVIVDILWGTVLMSIVTASMWYTRFLLG